MLSFIWAIFLTQAARADVTVEQLQRVAPTKAAALYLLAMGYPREDVEFVRRSMKDEGFTAESLRGVKIQSNAVSIGGYVLRLNDGESLELATKRFEKAMAGHASLFVPRAFAEASSHLQSAVRATTILGSINILKSLGHLADATALLTQQRAAAVLKGITNKVTRIDCTPTKEGQGFAGAVITFADGKKVDVLAMEKDDISEKSDSGAKAMYALDFQLRTGFCNDSPAQQAATFATFKEAQDRAAGTLRAPNGEPASGPAAPAGARK